MLFYPQALPLSLLAWNPNLESLPQSCTDQNGKSIFSRIDPFYLHNLPYNPKELISIGEK